jgi:hypothetical protein
MEMGPGLWLLEKKIEEAEQENRGEIKTSSKRIWDGETHMHPSLSTRAGKYSSTSSTC